MDHAPNRGSECYRIADVTIDSETRVMRRKGETLDMPYHYVGILLELLRNPECTLERGRLMQAGGAASDVLDKAISRFREIFGPEVIQTVRGFGYRLLVHPQKIEKLADGTAAGLVAHYQFERTADDSSGNGLNGTAFGAVSYIRADGVWAARIDATPETAETSRVSVPHADALALEEFTLSAWVKPAIINGRNRVLEKRGSFYIYLIPGDVVAGIQDGQTHDVPARFGIGCGTWHHIISTFNGRRLDLYVDCEQKNSVGSLKRTRPSVTTENLAIGWRPRGWPIDRYCGLIADVRIYNRAFESDEIGQLYDGLAETLVSTPA